MMSLLCYVAIGLVLVLVVGTFWFDGDLVDEPLLLVLGAGWPFFLIGAAVILAVGLACAPFYLTIQAAIWLNERWRSRSTKNDSSSCV